MDEASETRSWHWDRYTISTDRAELDVDRIHAFLTEQSYWARGVPVEVVRLTIDHSLNFGLFHETDGQVGFARVVTDYGVFAYLADVFVLPTHQGQGAGTWLLSTVVEHPGLQHLRRFSLATKDAHGFYAQFGFVAHPHPGDVLEIRHSVQELYGAPGES